MIRRWWVLTATSALVGCAAPGPQAPLAPLITPSAAGLAEPSTTAVFPVQAWWRELGDPALDAMIDRALAGQPGLQAVAARLAMADAAAQAVQASTGPQASLTADATRQRFSRNGLVPPAVAGSTHDVATVQANGRLGLDFFGRHAAALQVALGQQRAAAAELQAARVLLSAQLARGWVGLARLLALRDLAGQQLVQREDQRGLIAQRVAAGLDNALLLRSAEVAVPEVRQQIEALNGQITLARHQLAVLAGQAPQALATATPALQPLRLAAMPERLGADLLGRRADVVAARWRVEAALAQVARAGADFYPDIDLVGFVGLNALGLDRLLSLGSRQMGVGPALRLPLFDGGALSAQLGVRHAEADAAVAAYNAAVLQAAREAADASATLRTLALQQAEQARAADAAAAAHGLAQQRHRAGLANRLGVLDAETAVLAQGAAAADLRARALDAQVQLMQALGGGWREEAPSTAQR